MGNVENSILLILGETYFNLRIEEQKSQGMEKKIEELETSLEQANSTVAELTNELRTEGG